MSTASKNDNRKMYLILLIGVIIMLGIGVLPPFGQVTQIGMRLLGIFCGCIFIWLFGYISIGSIIGILLLALYVPENTGNTTFPAVFGNYNLIMILFCLIFLLWFAKKWCINLSCKINPFC